MADGDRAGEAFRVMKPMSYRVVKYRHVKFLVLIIYIIGVLDEAVKFARKY